MNKSTALGAVAVSDHRIGLGPSPHPSWCDRFNCDVDGVETYHSSAPAELKVGGGSIQLTLVRTDEHAHPERWGRMPELCMIVESGPVGQVGELAEVHLDLSEVPEVVALFTAQYDAGTASSYLSTADNGADRVPPRATAVAVPVVAGCDHSYVIMDVPGPNGTTATILVCLKCGAVA